MNVQQESNNDKPFIINAEHFSYMLFYVRNVDLSVNDEFKPEVGD